MECPQEFELEFRENIQKFVTQGESCVSLQNDQELEESIINDKAFYDWMRNKLIEHTIGVFEDINASYQNRILVYQDEMEKVCDEVKLEYLKKKSKVFAKYQDTTFYNTGLQENDSRLTYDKLFGLVHPSFKQVTNVFHWDVGTSNIETCTKQLGQPAESLFSMEDLVNRALSKLFRRSMVTFFPQTFALSPSVISSEFPPSYHLTELITNKRFVTTMNCGSILDVLYILVIWRFMKSLFGDKIGTKKFDEIFSDPNFPILFTMYIDSLPKKHFDILKHPVNALVKKNEQRAYTNHSSFFSDGKQGGYVFTAGCHYIIRGHPKYGNEGNGMLYNIVCVKNSRIVGYPEDNDEKIFCCFRMKGLVSLNGVVSWLRKDYNKKSTTDPEKFPYWSETTKIEDLRKKFICPKNSLSPERIMVFFLLPPDKRAIYIDHIYETEVKPKCFEGPGYMLYKLGMTFEEAKNYNSPLANNKTSPSHGV